MGRKPKGEKHVDDLEGSRFSKHRLAVLLSTLSGERTVQAACDELGIGASRLHVLRKRMLSSALSGIETRAAGRPSRSEPEGDAEKAALRAENARLERELELSRVREELALTQPGRRVKLLVKKGARAGKRRDARG
jgi:hypothetical protein